MVFPEQERSSLLASLIIELAQTWNGERSQLVGSSSHVMPEQCVSVLGLGVFPLLWSLIGCVLILWDLATWQLAWWWKGGTRATYNIQQPVVGLKDL